MLNKICVLISYFDRNSESYECTRIPLYNEYILTDYEHRTLIEPTNVLIIGWHTISYLILYLHLVLKATKGN